MAALNNGMCSAVNVRENSNACSTQTTTATSTKFAAVSVCCGPRQAAGNTKRRKRRWRKAIKDGAKKTIFWRRRNKYVDASTGDVEAWGNERVDDASSASSLCCYFDAHESSISETYIPDSLGYVRRKRSTAPESAPKKLSREEIQLSPELASVEDLLEELRQNPGPGPPLPRKPGGLTEEEMVKAEQFLSRIKEIGENTPAIYDQVYSFKDTESVASTICRWLRATKFDVDAVVQRLVDNQDHFDRAKSAEFYPNVGEAIGAPVSVFLSQYPFVCVGHSRNGYPVSYFQAGRVHPEGIMAFTTIEELEAYYWWAYQYKLKTELREASNLPLGKPCKVTCEAVNVVDLAGLQTKTLTSPETTAVIKLAGKISDFFPETMHKMLIINAPGFFTMFWGVIKTFIDPQTASRIQIFSNNTEAITALAEVIDLEQIPTDYGGTNGSIKQALTRFSSDNALVRQEIELLHCKRRGKTEGKEKWELQSGERLEVCVYTRSVSTGKITVKLDGSSACTIEACCVLESKADEEIIKTQCFKFDSHDLVGPCTVTLEAEDMDTAEKKHQSESRGFFLVVADVKQVSQSHNATGRERNLG